jgi:SAM-dependent methyltransferase
MSLLLTVLRKEIFMRYELVADNPAEVEALASSPTARTLFDPFLPVIQARALMAAVKLKIFAAIGGETRSASELATSLALDSGTLNLLLRVLACAGYLSTVGEKYRLTELARTSVLSASQHSLSAWIQHNYVHWLAIERLEEVLRTGQGVNAHASLEGEEQWEVYQQAMLETARPVAAWVADQIPVPAGAARLLDIGGSHGLYGAAICRAHPPLRSEVLELPPAVAPARRLAKNASIDDVVTHRAGDVRLVDLGQDSADVVFIGNLVHHLSAADNRSLFTRISQALRPGGTVAIWDFAMPALDAQPDLVADGLALLFRLGSSSRCYRVEELGTWLTAAGFVEIQAQPTPAPAHLLLTARHP